MEPPGVEHGIALSDAEHIEESRHVGQGHEAAEAGAGRDRRIGAQTCERVKVLPETV